MPQVINTNIMSLNAQRQLDKSQRAQNQAMERLSSGLRVNSAKDDAAGLSIATGMESQTRGLNQAIRNANDGISMAQTAEGAMDEMTNIMQRMRELAVQSANDTNSSSNRASIQKEVDQLYSELDRIANTTQFNGVVLLNGSAGQTNLQIGANSGESLSFSIDAVTSKDLNLNAVSGLGELNGGRTGSVGTIVGNGDVTLNGAFPEGKEILISAYQHGSWSGALPVGKGIVHEVNNEALVDGEFNLNTESGKEHYEAVKFAPGLTEWSYGFKITALDENNATWKDNPHVYRVLKSLDVFEASPVLRGAGENTTTLSIKSDKDGTSYTDQSEKALAAVSDWLSRTKALAALRKTEGREFSVANKERLTSLLKSLADIEGELKTLLAEPPEIKEKAQKLFLEASKLKMNFMEVTNVL